MAERRESVIVTADISNFTTRMAAAGAAARGFAHELDSADSRMNGLVVSGLALAPALIPIGAVAVPAITALASGLGFAAIGAGTAMLAFQGMGTALTAANKYALSPTQTNLDALKLQMESIGPAGRDMLVFLEKLGPELQKLQNVAQAGLFPGLQSGISSLMKDLPNVQRLISTVSGTLGDIAAAGGKALSGPFWRDFIDFLSTNARSTLTGFASSIGNVIEALASLWEAFTPLNLSFTKGLQDATRAFADWAAGLSATQGFKDFVAYIRDSGPKVAAALGAIGIALVNIVKAAAPLGGPTLAILRTLADVVGKLAASPVGTPLIALSAGLYALSSKAGGLSNLTKSVNTFSTSLGGAAFMTKARMFGAGAGLVALSMTNLDESLGVSNTLNFAAAGMFFGPWGAAAGAAAGSIQDARHMNDGFNASLQKTIDLANSSLTSPTDFSAQATQLAHLRAMADVTAGLNANLPGGVADSLVHANAAVDAFVAKRDNIRATLSDLQNGMTGSGAATVDYTTNFTKLSSIMSNAQPVLDQMGSSFDAMASAHQLGGATWTQFLAVFNKTATSMDSVAGRATSVGTAIAELGVKTVSTTTSAQNLSTALAALFTPQLNLSAAVNAWAAGLDHLNANLAKNTRSLSAQTDGGRKNRDTINAQVTAMLGLANAQAAAGQGPAKVAEGMKTMRESLMKAGIAAGFSKDHLAAYLDTLHLTPKFVSTLFKQLGINESQQRARDLRDAYNALPKDVRTAIAADGVQADATVASLMKKYDGLTKADATTIIQARDSASGKIAGVIFKLNSLHDKNVTVTVNTGQAAGAIAGLSIGLNGLHDKSLNVTTTHTTVNRHVSGHASGGYITGPGGPRDDAIPAWLSNGEFVVNAKSTAKHLALLHTLNAQHFATGGQALTPLQQRQKAAQDDRTVDSGLRTFNPRPGDDSKTVRSALRSLEKTLRGVYGRDATWLTYIDHLGSRIVKQTEHQDDLQKSLDKMTSSLHNLRSTAHQYGSTVAGAINNDPFGNGLAGFDLQVRADRNDNRRAEHYLKKARRHGLSGALLKDLAASGDLGTEQEIAQLSRKQIAREERLYNARNRAQGQLGQFAAQAVYGKRIQEQTHAVKEMRHDITHMSRVIDRQDRKLERAVERGSHSGTSHGIQQRNRHGSAVRQANR